MPNQRLTPIYGFLNPDASLSLLSDQFSSMNFDGALRRVYTQKLVSDLKSGDAIHFSAAENDEVIPVLVSAVELDDSEDTAYQTNPVYFIYYIDENGEDKNYTLGATTTDGGYLGTEYVYTSYEDPTTIDVGTSGWTITKYGNAVFSNVFTRGTVEATAGKIDGILTIGADENTAIQLGKGISIPGDTNIYNGLVINDTNYFVTKELASSTYTISSATTATESVDSGLSLVTFTINGHGLFTNTTGSKIVNLFGFTGGLISLNDSWSLNTSATNTITIIVPRITAGTYTGLSAQLEQDGITIRKSITSAVVTNVANVTNTNITFTTSANHNFAANNSVNISGLPATLDSVNGNFTLSSITANTFTIKAVTVTGTSPYTGLTGSVYKLYNTEQSIFNVGSQLNFMRYDSSTDVLQVTGKITASTINVGGASGISYDPAISSNIILGSNVVVNGNISGASGTFTGALSGATITGGTIAIGTAPNIFKADTNGIYLGNATFASAPFSVTPAGAIKATSGTIGGFTLSSTSLIAGSTSNAVGLNTTGYPFWAGDPTPASAPFSVTSAGAIKATSGTIAGWSLSGTELFSGTGSSRVSLNSSVGVIAIGSGNHGAIDTGFYADKDGKFSLSNQLIFTPVVATGRANVSTTGTTSGTTITVASATGIGKGMTVTGTGIATGTTVTNVVGTTITITPTVITNQSTAVPISFILDDMSELSVTGRIKGVIESVTPITSPRLSTTITNANITGTSPNQTATFTTNGHAFLPNEKIYVEGLPGTNGLSNLNNREYVLSTIPDSITLTVSLSGIVNKSHAVTGVTPSSPIAGSATYAAANHTFVIGDVVVISGATTAGYNGRFTITGIVSGASGTFTVVNATTATPFTFTSGLAIAGATTSSNSSLSATASLRELTMGLHPAEGVSGTDSWYHAAGTGLRLDKFNWWLTNNQFRVGTSGSYFNWNGSKFTIQGSGTKTLSFNVGSLDADNILSIVDNGVTPAHNTTTTPFFVNGAGNFSLGQKLVWTASTSTLAIDGTVTIGGTTGSTVVSGAASGASSLQPGTAAADINSNTTTISGGKIRTGTIESTGYTYSSGNFSSTGTQLNLDTGLFRSKNFFLDPTSGNAYLTGQINATSGNFTNIVTIGQSSTQGKLQVGTGTSFFEIIGTDQINTTAIKTNNSTGYNTSGVWIGADGKFSLGNNQLYFDGANLFAPAITTTSLTVGTSPNQMIMSPTAIPGGSGSPGLYMSKTGDFIDATTGGFRLGSSTGISYSGTGNVNIGAGATFAGALSAATGTFSGDISAASGTFTGSLSIGTGNSIFKADTNGIYLGNATFASAPFSVTPAGALTATGATISGTINASAGTFSGNITANGKLTTLGGLVFGTNVSSTNDGLYLNANNYFLINGTAASFRIGSASTAFVAIQNSDASTRLQVDTTNSTYAVEIGGSLRVNGSNAFIYGDLIGSASTALNAGALDSLDSTQFLRSDVSDSFTGGSLIIAPYSSNADFVFFGGGSSYSYDPILRTNGTAHAWGRIGYSANRMYRGDFTLLYVGTTQITSDERVKTSIENSDLGLDFINMLRPVKYKMINGFKQQFDEEGRLIEGLPGTRWHYGLIAQELKQTLDTYGLDSAMWSVEDFEENPDGFQAINYNQVTSPLIKAVQELSETVEILKNRLAALES
jgi:hypothetical protein